MGIIAPALIIVFFSFVFGKETNYKVGVIDNDNNYISEEIIKSVKDLDKVDVIEVSEEEYEILLVSHQVQLVVIINNGFSENILNLVDDEVTIKSISNSDVKASIVSIIKSKCEALSLIAKVSGNNLEKFKEISNSYEEKLLNVNTKTTKNSIPSIENSIGIVIMMFFITGATIANFIIEDEEGNTKPRVLASGIKPFKYYMSLMIVFYLLSCFSSVIYYIVCKLLSLNFNMANSSNFLVVMLMINLVSVSLNLCIVSFTRSRYIASTINILIVIPSCMMSGIFWEFEVMPKSLQKIGSYLPQRWVYICMEKLQQYDSLSYIKEYIFAMIGISIIFFIISTVMFRHRKEH